MPSFICLIPAVAFWGTGGFASVISTLPPTVRFINLAIRQVWMHLIGRLMIRKQEC